MFLNVKSRAYLALIITSIVWGTTWVVMKLGLKQLPPLELAAIRQLLAGLMFVLFFLAKKEPLPKVAQFKKLLLLAVLTFTMANAISTWSLNYISSGLGALIGTLYPLCVVLIEYFFYGNKNINKLTITGIVLGFAGIAVVFYDNAFHTPHGSGYLFGIFLALLAMLCWSMSTILISRKYLTMNPYYSMGWQMLISSVIVFACSLFSHKNIPLQSISLESWSYVLYLILAGSVLAIVAFVYSMKHLEPAIASLYAYINPIVAIFIGSFVLHEKITASIIIGSIVTLLGVYLVNYSIKKAVREGTEL